MAYGYHEAQPRYQSKKFGPASHSHGREISRSALRCYRFEPSNQPGSPVHVVRMPGCVGLRWLEEGRFHRFDPLATYRGSIVQLRVPEPSAPWSGTAVRSHRSPDRSSAGVPTIDTGPVAHPEHARPSPRSAHPPQEAPRRTAARQRRAQGRALRDRSQPSGPRETVAVDAGPPVKGVGAMTSPLSGLEGPLSRKASTKRAHQVDEAP